MKPTTNVLASAIALIALGGTAYAEMPKAVGEGEGEVDIVAWPGYIERGESDKAYDWVTAFDGIVVPALERVGRRQVVNVVPVVAVAV